MRIGVDIGQYAIKIHTGKSFPSKIGTDPSFEGDEMKLEYDGQVYYIGRGNYETNYDKASKETLIPFLLTAVATTTDERINQIIIGLPIKQYKKNKDKLIEQILKKDAYEFKYNDEDRILIIDKLAVVAEGVGAYMSLQTDEDMLVVDIGGVTTDIAKIKDGKVKEFDTLPVGTIKIYQSIADYIEKEFDIPMSVEEAEEVFDKRELMVDGIEQDLSFITSILKENFFAITEKLNQTKFNARTTKLTITGGGTKLFQKAFENRYQHVKPMDKPVFANAIGYKRWGDLAWS